MLHREPTEIGNAVRVHRWHKPLVCFVHTNRYLKRYKKSCFSFFCIQNASKILNRFIIL